MKVYNKEMLDAYLKNDWILEMLLKLEQSEDNDFRTHLWLKDMDNKRMIYADMYGDLLRGERKVKVLDVGGGYTALSKQIVENVDYTLLDLMAHGQAEKAIQIFSNNKNSSNIIVDDWYNTSTMSNFDIVIANDLFPDVDQRMEMFIERYLPLCKEMRLSLTFYNNPKYYPTRRIDDTEILTFLSYDGEIMELKLKKFLDRSNATSMELAALKNTNDSIFYNGRQVCYLVLDGDLKQQEP